MSAANRYETSEKMTMEGSPRTIVSKLTGLPVIVGQSDLPTVTSEEVRELLKEFQ